MVLALEMPLGTVMEDGEVVTTASPDCIDTMIPTKTSRK
jgi:hypothetical protein